MYVLCDCKWTQDIEYLIPFFIVLQIYYGANATAKIFPSSLRYNWMRNHCLLFLLFVWHTLYIVLVICLRRRSKQKDAYVLTISSREFVSLFVFYCVNQQLANHIFIWQRRIACKTSNVYYICNNVLLNAIEFSSPNPKMCDGKLPLVIK